MSRTLLAHLAPMFGPQTENLAVEALGHILSESEAARIALSELLQAGGANIGRVDQVRTQEAGEGGARPDLAGVDQDGKNHILIEAKFWAGLTENQPNSYLRRLESVSQPTALLFIAPAKRIGALWEELRRRLSAIVPDVALDSHGGTDELRSVEIHTGRHLILTSWRSLLGRMASKASTATDFHTEIDIRQLQGLAEQQDEEAFLPLRQEEFGPQFPRRVIDLTGLIDDAIARATKTEWANGEDRRMVATATSYGMWLRFPHAEKVFGKAEPFFGVEYQLWARCRETPLWLKFGRSTPPDLRSRLLALQHRELPELVKSNHEFWIPIELPVGKERGAVLDAVVARLKEISRLITPET